VSGSFARLVFGGLLGGIGLWLSLRNIPAGAISAALVSAQPVWFLAALTATLIALTAVVLRWKLLLLPSTVPASVLARATLVGQMLNIVLPFRLGEVARVYAVAGHSDTGVARITASLAIEKALDLAAFGIASAALVTTALVPKDTIREARWLVPLVVVVTLSGLAALMVRWRIGPRLAALVAQRDSRIARWLARVITEVSDGLDAWRSAGHATSVLTWTVMIFLLAAAGNQLLLRAFHFNLPLSTGVALLVVLQAGSVPPSLPGRLGIYNYLTVLTLGLYGVGRAQAATYSIALYLTAYVPKLLLGALIAADPSWRPWRSWTSRG
jgi:glycosyltransferase 2 family protein